MHTFESLTVGLRRTPPPIICWDQNFTAVNHSSARTAGSHAWKPFHLSSAAAGVFRWRCSVIRSATSGIFKIVLTDIFWQMFSKMSTCLPDVILWNTGDFSYLLDCFVKCVFFFCYQSNAIVFCVCVDLFPGMRLYSQKCHFKSFIDF